MVTKVCVCCRNPFVPYPQTPEQVFCSARACQKERRKRWRQQKMLTDPDYRDNQSRVQRAWLDRNPDYWRKYRNNNHHNPRKKLDNDRSPISGLYQIKFTSHKHSAKSDVWIAEITPICTTPPRKDNSCKDTT